MSLVSSGLSLIHVCTVERNANIGSTDDGWNNPDPPDWEPHIVGLACRAWTGRHRTVADKGTIAVIIEVNALVPLGTDIADGDRVTAVTYRGETIFAGPLAVHAVLARRDYLQLILAQPS